MCGAPFVHGYGELPSAYGTMTGYRLGLGVFPYLKVKVATLSSEVVEKAEDRCMP